MLKELTRSDVADLRAQLIENNYDEETIVDAIGAATLPSAEEMQLRLYRSREMNKLNALIRLFLLGASLPESDAAEILSPTFLQMGLATGLLEKQADRVASTIVIVPKGKLLFASDALRKLGSEDRADFVLPARTAASEMLDKLTVRTPAGASLDLGCGCGVHAILAARHSDSVVATDVSEAAAEFTEFNALLNEIGNVEVVVGDLFDAVDGRRFDRIICNPPFIVGPNQDFTYRDNPLGLDEFCRAIVQQAPPYLEENGTLQMLCEWVETESQIGRDRVAAWTSGIGCDAWVLRGSPKAPAAYVRERLSDVSGSGYSSSTNFDEWHDYLRQHQVTAIHSGMIVLRRRTGDNWFHMLSMSGAPMADAGDAVTARIAACDFLQLVEDDESLLDASITLSSDTELEQRFTRNNNAWATSQVTVRVLESLPVEAEIDVPVLAFLNHIDGRRTVRESIAAFAQSAGADASDISPQLLQAIRLFISSGVLAPIDVKDS